MIDQRDTAQDVSGLKKPVEGVFPKGFGDTGKFALAFLFQEGGCEVFKVLGVRDRRGEMDLAAVGVAVEQKTEATDEKKAKEPRRERQEAEKGKRQDHRVCLRISRKPVKSEVGSSEKTRVSGERRTNQKEQDADTPKGEQGTEAVRLLDPWADLLRR